MTMERDSLVARLTKRVYFDTEFIEDGKSIELVSIGMVRSDGATYYAEVAGVDYSRADPWLHENVFPHLQGGETVKPKAQIADEIKAFVGDEPEFWAYYADYDWVALCQLYGRMIDLPKGWPMFCRDLKQAANGAALPKQTSTEHHALADALWVRDAAAALSRHEQAVKALEEAGAWISGNLREDDISGCTVLSSVAKAIACLTTAAPFQADASAPASPAIGVQAVKALDELRTKIAAIPKHDRGFSWEASNYRGVEEMRCYGEIASMCMFVIDNADQLLSALHPAPEAASAAAAKTDGDLEKRLRSAHDAFAALEGVANDDLVAVLDAADFLTSDTAPSPKGVSDGEARTEPVAWLRRWYFDGIDVMAMKKVNRPAGWMLHAVTTNKMMSSDIPLFALSQEPVPSTAEERAAPAQQPVADTKTICTSFFRWWYNQPGANTDDGFDAWASTGEGKRLLSASSEPELRAEIVSLTRERDELRSYAHDATRAITSLTVGGSEFFGRKIGDIYTADLPFCVEHVRDRERRAHDRHIEAVSEKRAAESRVEALSAALEQIATLNRSRDQLQEMARAALDNGATT